MDSLGCHLFLPEIAGLTDEAQVRFQPPDEEWRTYVSNLTVGWQSANALNVYLTELRENRKLRANERVRSVDSRTTSEQTGPLACRFESADS